MSSPKQSIGVVGLGIMGMAMAQNIRKAGFQVIVTTRSQEKKKQAADTGLQVVASSREVAEQSQTIIVMVTDPAAVETVLSGTNGVFNAKVEGKHLIQMSTLDEPATLKFAQSAHEHGMTFLDCPVAGSKAQVTQAQLILLVGGDIVLLESHRELLLSMGKTIVHAGAVGKGTALKLCMNLIVAQMTTALCESVALAHAQEIDPKTIFDVIRNSPALNCGYFQIKEKALLDENFSPAFSLSNMLKDVRFMDATSEREHLKLPVTQAVRLLMEQALNSGFGEEDLVSIIKVLNK